MTSEKEREAFEKWWADKYGRSAHSEEFKGDLLIGWLGRAALAQAGMTLAQAEPAPAAAEAKVPAVPSSAVNRYRAPESPAGMSVQPYAPVASFQERVQPWMMACFGPEISADRLERGDRLLEEVLELLQSGDYPRERIAALTDYVFDRPQGEINQEVGGVMVTLAAYCLAFGLNMHAAGETELARIWTKVEKIRAKQAAKPTGSALPVAAPPAAPAAEVDAVGLGRELWWPHHQSRTRSVALADLDAGALGEVVLEFGDVLEIVRAVLAHLGITDTSQKEG